MNKENLIKAIGEAATDKGVDIPVTDGLSNSKLEEVLEGLKSDAPPPPENGAEAAELARKEAEEQREKDDAEAAELVEKNKPEYQVAPGKAITCKKGIVADGDEVKAEYFIDGDKAVKRFVKSGHIIKN